MNDNGSVVPKNKLTRRECRALEDMLLKHAQEVTAGKWTQCSFAEYATCVMNRPVTAANVRGSAKAVDVKFKRRETVLGKSNHQLREAVRLLAQELAKVKQKMCMVCSPTLLELAKDGEQE